MCVGMHAYTRTILYVNDAEDIGVSRVNSSRIPDPFLETFWKFRGTFQRTSTIVRKDRRGRNARTYDRNRGSVDSSTKVFQRQDIPTSFSLLLASTHTHTHDHAKFVSQFSFVSFVQNSNHVEARKVVPMRSTIFPGRKDTRNFSRRRALFA